jgi:hypothetical protein
MSINNQHAKNEWLWANKGWNTIVEMVCVGKIAMDNKCKIIQFVAIFLSWSLVNL